MDAGRFDVLPCSSDARPASRLRSPRRLLGTHRSHRRTGQDHVAPLENARVELGRRVCPGDARVDPAFSAGSE